MTETLIESIRAAIAEGSTREARAAGAAACRTILAALEAVPGERLVAQAAPAQHGSSPIAAIVAGLRGTPPDQLLDLLIAKLRSMVPPEKQSPASKINLQLVRIPAP